MTTPSAPVPAGWQGLLAPDERILWQGNPDGRIAWRDILGFASVFGMVFLSFSLFWVIMAFMATRDGPAFIGVVFPGFGMIFVVIGAYLAVGRLFTDAWARRGTTYTLTDRAAFIGTNVAGRRRLDRYPLDPGMTLALDPGPPGTVWFAAATPGLPAGVPLARAALRPGRRNSPGQRRTPATQQRIGFRRIDDAQTLFGILRTAIAALPDKNSP